MNTIASWILESFVAAVVIIVCLGIPSLLNLPLWSLTLSGILAILYLFWRLDHEHFTWQFAILIAIVVGAAGMIQAYVIPEAWRSKYMIVVVVVISAFGSYLHRKKKASNRA